MDAREDINADRLEGYRKAGSRERPDFFERWLEHYGFRAASLNEPPRISKHKQRLIERLSKMG